MNFLINRELSRKTFSVVVILNRITSPFFIGHVTDIIFQ